MKRYFVFAPDSQEIEHNDAKGSCIFTLYMACRPSLAFKNLRGGGDNDEVVFMCNEYEEDQNRILLHVELP